MAFKIATFSLDPLTISRLVTLTEWKHNPNKSSIVTQLIEQEYRRLLELREEEAAN